MTAVISSARLDLVALIPGVLHLIEARDTAGIGALLGVSVPAHWPETVQADMKLKQLAEKPDAQPWLVRGIVLRSEGRLVGEIGFHCPPDELAVLEIGYEVLPEYRRRGYAREALLALTDWAYSTGQAEIVYVTIDAGNAASIGLVKSVGFCYDEEQWDPREGPMVFYEAKLPLPR